MDTSGTTLGPRSASAPKPENFSKEELSAILKYLQLLLLSRVDLLLMKPHLLLRFGAQSLFKTDEGTQTKKLDELDLDDILNRAEDHETEGVDAGGASLGGEGFLQQFAAVQDVKADMSWDDIIPIEERSQMEVEQAQKTEAENLELLSRRRAAATRPGAYEHMDDEKEVRGPESSNEGSPPPQKKPINRATGPKKTAAQKSLELRGLSCSSSNLGFISFPHAHFSRRSFTQRKTFEHSFDRFRSGEMSDCDTSTLYVPSIHRTPLLT